MKDILNGVIQWFHSAWTSIGLWWAFLFSIFVYLAFPDQSFVPPACALLVIIGLDIITKYYAISVQSGGFWKCIVIGKWKSETFWKGSAAKVFGYAIMLILCGQTIKATGALSFIGKDFSIFAYTIMLLRELQSVAENMVEAGDDRFVFVANMFKMKLKNYLNINGLDDKKEKKNTRRNNR